LAERELLRLDWHRLRRRWWSLRGSEPGPVIPWSNDLSNRKAFDALSYRLSGRRRRAYVYSSQHCD
jgi:hypothetical protein